MCASPWASALSVRLARRIILLPQGLGVRHLARHLATPEPRGCLPLADVATLAWSRAGQPPDGSGPGRPRPASRSQLRSTCLAEGRGQARGWRARAGRGRARLRNHPAAEGGNLKPPWSREGDAEAAEGTGDAHAQQPSSGARARRRLSRCRAIARPGWSRLGGAPGRGTLSGRPQAGAWAGRTKAGFPQVINCPLDTPEARRSGRF